MPKHGYEQQNTWQLVEMHLFAGRLGSSSCQVVWHPSVGTLCEVLIFVVFQHLGHVGLLGIPWLAVLAWNTTCIATWSPNISCW